MPPTTTIFRAARPVFQSTASPSAFSRNTGFRFGSNGSSSRFSQQSGGRRFQSTATDGTAQPSWFQRMWNSPIGFKTVHFWAPVMKWSIVIAGIGDFARPAEKLSLTQNGALTATGLIWTRWCFVIKPRNILLAAVNFFLGCVGVIQVTRIMIYRSSVKDKENQPLAKKVEEGINEAKEAVVKS